MSLPVWLPDPMFLLGGSVPGPMFLLGGGFCRETSPNQKRTVRILLECFLVMNEITRCKMNPV